MWNANARWLVVAGLLVAVGAGPACTDTSADKAKADAGAAVDATKAGAEKAMDATKKAGEKTLDATKDVAGDVADKTKEIASAAGEVVTDTWITAKVKAKLADEKSLNGADIKVETTDHLVTLTGTVPSAAARARAVEIARGTEPVTRVVDKLVVAQP